MIRRLAKRLLFITKTPGGGGGGGAAPIPSRSQALPYTLLAADLGYVLFLTGTGILTCPDALADGFNVGLVDDDALGGKVIHAVSTLNSVAGPTGDITLDGQNARADLESRTSGVWYSSGDAS